MPQTQIRRPKVVTMLTPSVIYNKTIYLLPNPEIGDTPTEAKSDLKPPDLLQRAMCGNQQETSENGLIVFVSSVYVQKGREK